MMSDQPLSGKEKNKSHVESRAEEIREEKSLRDEVRNKLIASGVSEEKIDKVLPDVSDDLKEQSVSALIRLSYSRGPLPPPDMLRAYNDAAPGAANSIIAMAEENQRHHLTYLKREQDTQNKILILEQILPFIITIFSMISGSALIVFDITVIGSTLVFAPLLGRATIYIRNEFWHKHDSDKNPNKAKDD